METYPSMPAVGNLRPSEDAQKFVSELKSEVRGLADHATEAVRDLGAHASKALDDLKVASQEVMDEYTDRLSRGKRQVQNLARRVEKYSDQNTALVAGGALLIGVLLGHILTRRSKS